MRKTAGYCITGEVRAGEGRYARIEMSEKVCDSAGITLNQPKVSNACHMQQHFADAVFDL